MAAVLRLLAEKYECGVLMLEPEVAMEHLWALAKR
jgi:hypothetical protein